MKIDAKFQFSDFWGMAWEVIGTSAVVVLVGEAFFVIFGR